MNRKKELKWIILPALIGLVLGSAARGAAQTAAHSHELKLTPANVTWGPITGNTKPVLRVASGDTIAVETFGDSVVNYLRFGGIPDSEIPASLRDLQAYGEAHGFSGSPTTGPIYVEGAEPGDTLAIHFQKFEFLHPYGWTQITPGRGTLPDEFPFFKVKILHYNVAKGTVEFAPGVTLKLAPFWGVTQVAPPLAPRAVQETSPGPLGGNMDDKDLGAGSTLYLPVQVPGALLSFADSHALQGDGEITISASETSLRGTVQVSVLKGKRILWPRAETPTEYMTMGVNPDLNEATRLAVRDMLDFLTTEKGMSREDAYMLCTLAVNLHITEFVDNPKGVRAKVSKSIFKDTSPAISSSAATAIPTRRN
jgi:acetamidase/formamidase